MVRYRLFALGTLFWFSILTLIFVGQPVKIAAKVNQQTHTQNTKQVWTHSMEQRLVKVCTEVENETTKGGQSKETKIVGKVTDEDGKPISKAKVSTMGCGNWYSTQTDEAGNYELSGLSHGLQLVSAKHDVDGKLVGSFHQIYVKDFETKTANFSLSQSTSKEKGAIEGSVVDDQNSPIASANVYVYTKDFSSAFYTTSDKDGYFIIGGIAPDEYVLSVDTKRSDGFFVSIDLVQKLKENKTEKVTISLPVKTQYDTKLSVKTIDATDKDFLVPDSISITGVDNGLYFSKSLLSEDPTILDSFPPGKYLIKANIQYNVFMSVSHEEVIRSGKTTNIELSMPFMDIPDSG